MLEKSLAAVGIGPMRGHFLEVVPSRKQFSGSRQDYDMDRQIIASGFKFRQQRLHHLDREDVGWRVLQRQTKDSTLPFGADQRLTAIALGFKKFGHVR